MITLDGVTSIDPWQALFATDDNPYVLHVNCPTCWKDTRLVADVALFIVNQGQPSADERIKLPCHCRASKLDIYERIRGAIK